MLAGFQTTHHDFVAAVIALAVHVLAGALLFLGLNVSDVPHSEPVEHDFMPAEIWDEAAILEARERLAEEARRRAAAEEAERQARLAQAEREAQQQRQAEQRRREEQARRAEAARRAEEARQAEVRRRAEEARRAEAARRAEEARKAEAARKAEETRKAEAARRAEETRRAEAARKAEEERRKAEEARKLAAELAAREAATRHARQAIMPHIRRQWVLPPSARPGLSCTLKITITASGVVTRVDIVRGSGDDLFDNSAKAAVLKASPLPVPADSAVLSELNAFQWRFRPED